MNSLLHVLLWVFLVSSPDESPLNEEIEYEHEITDFRTCPPMEHLRKCAAHCQRNCTNFNQPIVCPDICIEGCVCGRGLVRAMNGLCVPPSQCPGEDRCPKGTHFDQCNARCQKTCSNWNKPIACPAVCFNGCVCDEGTVRGPNGQCVAPEQCHKEAESEQVTNVEH